MQLGEEGVGSVPHTPLSISHGEKRQKVSVRRTQAVWGRPASASERDDAAPQARDSEASTGRAGAVVQTRCARVLATIPRVDRTATRIVAARVRARRAIANVSPSRWSRILTVRVPRPTV